MAEAFPVLNTKTDYEKEFLKQYSKDFEAPSTKCLKAFFHPTLRDHVITINEVNFPKVKAEQVTTLFHNRQSDGFENKIRNKYIDSVSHLIVKRRKKLNQNVTFRNRSEDESFPSEPDSSEWEGSDSNFEGGQNEKPRTRNSFKSKPKPNPNKEQKRKVNINNQIIINDPPKLKGSYPKTSSKNLITKQLGENQTNAKNYSKAVDLYLEDHCSLFSYQDYDESMKPDEPEDDTANYLYSGDKYRIDEYSAERDKYNRYCYLYYNPIPSVDDLIYLPPPFRSKFEICVWRIDIQNVAKIKHSYFTPELIADDQLANCYFNAVIGIDSQTMMLVQTNSQDDKILILMFDVYTLDKITEFYVNVSNPILVESSDYNENDDIYGSTYAQNNRTDYNFPRISCWNSGKYILVGVGAKPLSKIYPEFRVYDSESNKIIGNFSRNGNPATESLMVNVFNNPQDADTVLFLMRNEYTYTIVEADVIHNESKEICSISSYDFNFIKLSEDLSCIFVGSRKDYMENYKLYRCEYGKDYNFTTEKHKSIVEFQYSSQTQIIGDSILISYINKKGENHVGVFSEEEDLDIENENIYYGIEGFSILEETLQILAITRVSNDGPEILVLDNNVDASTTMSCSEYTQIRFEYPNVLFIKGGLEIIYYHVITKNYTYINLPCPIANIKFDSKNNMSMCLLFDLGKYFAYADMNIYSNNANLIFNLNYILKRNLPHEKLINLIGYTEMKFKLQKPENAYLLLFLNSVVGYSADEIGKYDIKKAQYSIEEIFMFLGDVRGLIVYKKETKKINLVKVPIDFNDKSNTEVIFESQDLIKCVKSEYVKFSYQLQIVDEAKYLKIGLVETHNDKIVVRIDTEYFVDKYFVGDGYWTFANNAIVSGTSCIRVQDRGDENENIDTITYISLDGYSYENPIVSDKSVLYLYESYYSSGRKIKIMPHSSSPILTVTPSNDVWNIKAEFFYCCHSTKEEFIVYVTQAYSMDCIKFDFYKSNGTLVYSKRFTCEGMNGYDYYTIDIKVSPNGKYIYMKLNSKDDPNNIVAEEHKQPEEGKKKSKKDKLKDRDYFQTYGPLKDGYIFEIVMLRRSSSIKRVGNSVKKFKLNSKREINLDDIKLKIEAEDIMFDLKLVRIFKNVDKYFGYNTPKISSIGTLSTYCYNNDYSSLCLLYETFDLSKFIEGELGIDEKTTEKYKSKDFRWECISPGFIGYLDDRAIFVRVDVDIGKTEEMVYNPATNKGEITEIMTIFPKPK